MKSANTTRLWPGRPLRTGAMATSAPRGTPYGAAESTASANASFSLMTVRSPVAVAAPPGIGVGPGTTRTAAYTPLAANVASASGSHEGLTRIRSSRCAVDTNGGAVANHAGHGQCVGTRRVTHVWQ